ncbi:MAG: ferrous iron transport protein B [Clostridia bacterium]|nr:ferrous iron transport protein B [Clostridia bacterium]
MGLTKNSTGIKSVDNGFVVTKNNETDKIVALAGNPNVGKSTVFNSLTGLKQHTGNWPGKTVTNAFGTCKYNEKDYILVDIPGTYSLMAHSKEEEVARDFICFGNADKVIVVCDATCLERNLNLVLQTTEIKNNVIVCVNLMDEAKRKGIEIDLDKLQSILGVPVVGTDASKGRGLTDLLDKIETINTNPFTVRYVKPIEEALNKITNMLKNKIEDTELNLRWIGLKLLDYDEELVSNISKYVGYDLDKDADFIRVRDNLAKKGYCGQKLTDAIVSCIVLTAEDICNETVVYSNTKYTKKDRKIDKILTSRITGIPVMLLLLGVVLWITIVGSNYISDYLSVALFWVEDMLVKFFVYINAPRTLYEVLVFGVYRVLAWVVSVMLPPMAIFFPLFTLLEDLGYLPRIAFNLDKSFRKCNACGKQALTMCMGFGCNAAGVVGCRIIDSPRERLIAMITNSFVPCNGRFPTLISIITMFLVCYVPDGLKSVSGAILLTLFILFGIMMTFFVSFILSKTVLKGEVSAFTLELPPYRKPKIGRIIMTSIIDRTLFVLGRAIIVAAPAGLIIWILANVSVGGTSLLLYCSNFLDPFARLMGMDGVILFAFILGFPANEIVIPIIIMSYMSTGTLINITDLSVLRDLLVSNGWTWVTAISVMFFSLMHWPCSTTLMTIKKESGSIKWTVLSAVVPTLCGFAVCFLLNVVVTLLLIL